MAYIKQEIEKFKDIPEHAIALKKFYAVPGCDQAYFVTAVFAGIYNEIEPALAKIGVGKKYADALKEAKGKPRVGPAFIDDDMEERIKKLPRKELRILQNIFSYEAWICIDFDD